MSKYGRRHVYGAFVQRHRPGCMCVGDHCGEVDARRAARAWSVEHFSKSDDVRTAQLARSLGLNVRRRRTA